MAAQQALAGFVDVEVGNTLIILNVTSDQSQVVMDGSCSNEDIKITDNFACPSQFSSDASKILHDRLSRRKNNDRAQEALKHVCCFLWIAPKMNTLIDFSIGNKTDSEIILCKR